MDKQEPVGFFSVNDYGNWEENENGHGTPLYTAPPKKEWVGLTEAEVVDLWNFPNWFVDFKRAYEVIQAKLKEKNT